MYYGKCEYCGGDTKAKYKSLLKRFCSHKCANKFNHENVIEHKRANRIVVKCDNCGKEIVLTENSPRLHASKKHFFCCRKCMSNYYQQHPKLSTCVVCGKTFKKNRSKQTCSEECLRLLLRMRGFDGGSETIEEYKIKKNKRDEQDRQRKERRENHINVYAGREKEYLLEYREKNKDKIYKRVRKRMEEDELFKFKCDVRKKIQTAFTRRKVRKVHHTIDILGCSIEEFREYIKSKFKERMSFENYGEWQLDHIIPLATANTVEEVEKLCHYTNYQPLWAKENIQKSDKLDWHGN